MQEDKLIAKAELLRKLRRIDLIKDQKKNCLRRAIPYVKPKANIHEFLYWESKNKLYAKADETAKEVHAFKTALGNVEAVLKQLTEMQIRNERPADYLVEMYKSDKQMFKVRKHLIVK